MGKKTEYNDYHVKVYPRRMGDYGVFSIGGQPGWTPEQQRTMCENIAAAIKRHVSKFDDDRGAVIIDCETYHTCEHCGQPWTEASNTYNGGCCDADEEAEEKRRTTSENVT